MVYIFLPVDIHTLLIEHVQPHHLQLDWNFEFVWRRVSHIPIPILVIFLSIRVLPSKYGTMLVSQVFMIANPIQSGNSVCIGCLEHKAFSQHKIWLNWPKFVFMSDR